MVFYLLRFVIVITLDFIGLDLVFATIFLCLFRFLVTAFFCFFFMFLAGVFFLDKNRGKSPFGTAYMLINSNSHCRRDKYGDQ